VTRAILLVCCLAATASAQDTSFSRLRLRGGALMPVSTGRIGNDWNAKLGAQVEAASNVGRSEIAFGVAHLGFEPTASTPSFTETLFLLSWTAPVWTSSRAGFYAGARVTDIRMDFDDPSLVGGLTTEEETMLAAVARARLGVAKRFSGFAEASYGVALHSTRTPMWFVTIGLERNVAMPRWLRDVLR
jgi:hypothetical protein